MDEVTVKLIYQLGAWAVIGAAFIVLIKWLLGHVSKLVDTNRESSQHFAEVAQGFKATVDNHMRDCTETQQKLVSAIENMSKPKSNRRR